MEFLLMSGFGSFIFFIVSMAIMIAPLLIWRNTNRTNKLLGAIAKQQGVSQEEVDEILGKTSSRPATANSSWEELQKKKED